MGREVRRVPPNWAHPETQDVWGRYRPQPMFDRTYEEARQEWLDGLSAHDPDKCDGADFWEWGGGPPNRAYYRPWKDDDATWFQLWETVSEGTPVSPPFATRQELADYLANNGDFWDQKRGNPGWGKRAAERFVEVGWAPSAAVINGAMVESRDIPSVTAAPAAEGNE